MADKSGELRAFAPALILLAICALINYVDRGNLSIAAPLLKDELRVSASQLGLRWKKRGQHTASNMRWASTEKSREEFWKAARIKEPGRGGSFRPNSAMFRSRSR